MPGPSATSTLPTDIEPGTRRIGYAITSLFLVVLIGLAVVDGVTPAAIFGVQSTTIRAEAEGTELAVTYGQVSRPALATPFDIRVEQDEGFDGPVRIAVDQAYLRLWDENGVVPAPSSETVLGPWVVWEFDQPPGTTLLVTFDARIEPAAQQGRDGAVAVLDDDDVPIVELAFTTRVLP